MLALGLELGEMCVMLDCLIRIIRKIPTQPRRLLVSYVLCTTESTGCFSEFGNSGRVCDFCFGRKRDEVG